MAPQVKLGRATAFSALLVASAAAAAPSARFKCCLEQLLSAGEGGQRVLKGSICKGVAQDKEEPDRQLDEPAEAKAKAPG
jgi:hypothetical protein